MHRARALEAPADYGREAVKLRDAYHLVIDCLKGNQGKKSHKDVEATRIHHFNTNTGITVTKAKPFPEGKQADILLYGRHRQPGCPELAPRRHVHQSYGGYQARSSSTELRSATSLA